jgi:hypothetical protein
MRPGKGIAKPEKVKETIVPINQAPKKVRFQLVREIAGESNPVVVKSKMIPKTQELVPYRKLKPLPRAYFVRSLIKREREVKGILWGKKTVTEYIARCNIYWSESLESLNESIPRFSRELENLKVSDDVVQHRDSIADMQRFIFDSEFLKVLIVVFALAVPFGIFLNTLLHLIPAQVITWQP